MPNPKPDSTLALLQRVCAKLPGAEQYVMVHHPAFRVGKKPFAVLGMQIDAEDDTVSVNLGREAQDQLLEDPRFHKTPYLHQHGWVTIATRSLRAGELEALTRESWQRIASRKLLAQMGHDGAPEAAGAGRKRPGKSGTGKR